MIPPTTRFHIPEVLLQTTRQIPRHDAWTQIATLDTGKIVTEIIAELAWEIRPDIASGGIGRVDSRRWLVRSKRIAAAEITLSAASVPVVLTGNLDTVIIKAQFQTQDTMQTQTGRKA